MAASARFEIDTKLRAVALSAAAFLPGFYPQVGVELLPDAILLRSETLDREALETIWTSAFANEHLLIRGRERRAAAFEILTR
jgi:hypothetical protein